MCGNYMSLMRRHSNAGYSKATPGESCAVAIMPAPPKQMWPG